MPQIVVEKGDKRGGSYRIGDGSTVFVGRGRSADIILSDTLVSRRHLAIQSRDGSFYVRDLGSRNGVYVNGRRVAEAPVQPGDRIQAGESLLSFLDDAERRTSGGLVGVDIAGHRIIERIGRGGAGTVYKAVQLSLDRPVAIKLLAPDLVRTPDSVNRFFAEARAAGRLSHSNIVQVFDAGRWADLCYYTMEFMPFGSIGDEVAAGRTLPAAYVLPMMVDVAHGLIYAEKHGVVHRDIKPENLMIGHDGVVKICDLGIAKMLDRGGPVGQRDGVFGSAHFMAPEQALGRDIDCRVDIYAMGATFYRVLTGRYLFKGRSREAIMLAHVQQPPAPMQDIAPSVPPKLAAVIHRMLEKDPAARYRSAREFVGVLENLARWYRWEKT